MREYSSHLIDTTTLQDLRAEAIRAHTLHGDGSMMNLNKTDVERFSILSEEVGEVAHALNEFILGNCTWHELQDELQKELIQVGAMAVSWIEAIRHA